MKIIKSENKLCHICMNKHEVQTVNCVASEIYNDKKIYFNVIYEYCSLADSYLETEDMFKINNLSYKNAIQNNN